MAKSDKENYINLMTDAYKKIMDVAFIDPATDDVEDSEMVDDIPKEDR
jgi:hypothetical protein